MRLMILDPNLVDRHGHHALYDRLLAGEAQRRGVEVAIVANIRFGATELDGVRVHPILSNTCYTTFSADPLFGAYDDVEQGNAETYRDLSELPRDFLLPNDMLVVHTVSHTTLLGTVRWLADMAEETRPMAAIMLMLPSGISLHVDGQAGLRDPAVALGYRLAFRAAREAGLDILFLGSGHQHAREFSTLRGSPVEPHALITSFDQFTPAARPRGERVLLFAGDAKMDKGLGLLPGIVENLLPRYPEIAFVIHANPGPAWGEALSVLDRLRRIALRMPNLDLRLDALEGQTYVDLLASATIILLPYDPVTYAHKSSGVMWEAIAAGSRTVVPAFTWLAEEAQFWGADCESFERYDAACITVALERAIAGAAEHQAVVRHAAERFRAANGIKPLFDTLADRWVAGLAIGAEHWRPEFVIEADALSGRGWHGVEEYRGERVRWTSDCAATLFRARAPGRWTATFDVVHALDRVPVEGATILLDGAPLPTVCRPVQGRGWQVVASFDEAAPSPPERTIALAVPRTVTSDTDQRALGLLVRSLRVSAAEERARAGAARRLSPASLEAQPLDDGWTEPFHHAAWRLETGQRSDMRLMLRVRTMDDPLAIRGVQIFAAGHLVTFRAEKSAAPALLGTAVGGEWACDVDIPVQLLQTMYRHVDLDITSPSLVSVCMAEPEVSNGSDGAEAVGAMLKQATPAWVRSSAARAIEGGWADMPSHLKPFITQVERREELSFINIQVAGFGPGLHRFAPFYFKLLVGTEFYALELRERDGAFQLISDPDPAQVRSDAWGQHIVVFCSRDGKNLGVALRELARSQKFLEELFALLPALTARALAAMDQMPEDGAEWMLAARTLSELGAQEYGSPTA